MKEKASAEELEELREMMVDPRYEDAVRELLDEALHRENEYRLSDQAAAEMLAGIFDSVGQKSVVPGPSRVRKLWKYAAAAAVLTALIWLGFNQWSGKTIQQPALAENAKSGSLPATDIEPGWEQAVLVLGDGSTINLSEHAAGRLADQQGVLLTTEDNQLSYEGAGAGQGNEPELMNSIHVPRKGHYALTLSDGTKVWLNAESSLHYPVSFKGSERVVELKGEGYFEVARNTSKPFRVKVGDIDVEVLGTHFNIMSYGNEEVVQTTLLEGSVQVQRATELMKLAPGEQAEFNKTRKSWQKRMPDLDETMAWRNGYFLFSGRASLSTVMRQLERWYDIEVLYEGKEPKQSFGGGIQRSLPLSGVLAVLKESGIRFTVKEKQLTIID